MQCKDANLIDRCIESPQDPNLSRAKPITIRIFLHEGSIDGI